ncbi:MAG: hypothetical protein FJ108_16530 [Deltaproteobacteria bacterium]|nr:hypothetical protein [Deltaproteobacteria bacterium]
MRQAIGGDTTRVRFCEWFYVSDGDTFVTHGHQYDPYCAADPVHPLIEVRGKSRVRIPFGDLANRFMLNGMGYFNPHATNNYIMSGKQYVRFFFKYMVRTEDRTNKRDPSPEFRQEAFCNIRRQRGIGRPKR